MFIGTHLWYLPELTKTEKHIRCHTHAHNTVCRLRIPRSESLNLRYSRIQVLWSINMIPSGWCSHTHRLSYVWLCNKYTIHKWGCVWACAPHPWHLISIQKHSWIGKPLKSQALLLQAFGPLSTASKGHGDSYYARKKKGVWSLGIWAAVLNRVGEGRPHWEGRCLVRVL